MQAVDCGAGQNFGDAQEEESPSLSFKTEHRISAIKRLGCEMLVGVKSKITRGLRCAGRTLPSDVSLAIGSVLLARFASNGAWAQNMPANPLAGPSLMQETKDGIRKSTESR